MAHSITDAEALSLMKMAKYLVGQQIKAGLVKEEDGNDYVQELLLGIMKKLDTMEIPAESAFENFAYLIMKRDLIDVWRKFHPQLPASGKLLSMHTLVKNSEGETTEFGNLLTGDEANPESEQAKERRLMLKFDVRVFLAALSAEDRQFCEMLMICGGQRAAARATNMSRSAVRRKIVALRKKMTAAGLDKYLEKNF